MRLELPGQVAQQAAHAVRLTAHGRAVPGHCFVKISKRAPVVVAVALERRLAARELLEALDLLKEERVAWRAHGRQARRAARSAPRS